MQKNIKIEVYHETDSTFPVGQLDIDSNVDFPLAITYSVKDIRSLNESLGSFTKTFEVPATENNNAIFKNVLMENTKNYTDIVSTSLLARVYAKNILVLSGRLTIDSINKFKRTSTYSLTIYGDNNIWSHKFSEENMCEVTSWGQSTFTWNNTNWKNINNTVNDSDDGEYCIPYFQNGMPTTSLETVIPEQGLSPDSWVTDEISKMSLMDISISIFVKSYLKGIFNEAGYTLISSFFDTDFFKKLCMPTPPEYWLKTVDHCENNSAKAEFSRAGMTHGSIDTGNSCINGTSSWNDLQPNWFMIDSQHLQSSGFSPVEVVTPPYWDIWVNNSIGNLNASLNNMEWEDTTWEDNALLGSGYELTGGVFSGEQGWFRLPFNYEISDTNNRQQICAGITTKQGGFVDAPTVTFDSDVMGEQRYEVSMTGYTQPYEYKAPEKGLYDIELRVACGVSCRRINDLPTGGLDDTGFNPDIWGNVDTTNIPFHICRKPVGSTTYEVIAEELVPAPSYINSESELTEDGWTGNNPENTMAYRNVHIKLENYLLNTGDIIFARVGNQPYIDATQQLGGGYNNAENGFFWKVLFFTREFNYSSGNDCTFPFGANWIPKADQNPECNDGSASGYDMTTHYGNGVAGMPNQPPNSFIKITMKRDILYGNENIKASFALPCSEKKIDFIAGLTHAFNLVWTTDEVSKKVYVEPYDDFYDSVGNALDWSKKLDFSQQQSNTFLSDELPKTMRLGYSLNNADQFITELYKFEDNKYQDMEINIGNEFLPETQENRNPFFQASYMHLDQITCAFNGIGFWCHYIGDSYVSEETTMLGKSDSKKKAFHRLLYYEGNVDYEDDGLYFWLDSLLGYPAEEPPISRKAPTASSFKSTLTDDQTTADHNLGYNDYTYAGSGVTVEGLYSKYWRPAIKQILSNPIIKTAYIMLNESDIANLDLRKFVYLEDFAGANGNYWIVNKVIDYNPSQSIPTKVELIQYRPNESFTITETNSEDTDTITVTPDGEGYIPWNGGNVIYDDGTNITTVPQKDKGKSLSVQGQGNFVAQNMGIIAVGSNLKATKQPGQIVLGQYNQDVKGMRLVIGGGTSNKNRQNVLTVDMRGNVNFGASDIVVYDDDGKLQDVYVEQEKYKLVKLKKTF